MNETEIAQKITTFEEALKHLATKEDLLAVRVDMEKHRGELIRWIIATNIAVGGVVITAMVYLTTQFSFVLQHWKP